MKTFRIWHMLANILREVEATKKSQRELYWTMLRMQETLERLENNSSKKE